MKKILYFILGLNIFLLPAFALAQTQVPTPSEFRADEVKIGNNYGFDLQWKMPKGEYGFVINKKTGDQVKLLTVINISSAIDNDIYHFNDPNIIKNQNYRYFIFAYDRNGSISETITTSGSFSADSDGSLYSTSCPASDDMIFGSSVCFNPVRVSQGSTGGYVGIGSVQYRLEGFNASASQVTSQDFTSTISENRSTIWTSLKTKWTQLLSGGSDMDISGITPDNGANSTLRINGLKAGYYSLTLSKDNYEKIIINFTIDNSQQLIIPQSNSVLTARKNAEPPAIDEGVIYLNGLYNSAKGDLFYSPLEAWLGWQASK